LGRPRLLQAWTAATVAVSIVLSPLGLPILPPRAMADSGIWKARKDFADMYGWPELARQVTAAYEALPDRSNALVLAGNYGEAGAIERYDPEVPVVSPHLSFYYWAPARMDPETVVAVGYDRAKLERYFGNVEQVGVVSNDYGVANEEAGGPIFVCRQPKQPLWQAWPSLKSLD
jgi:hypothetical protein